MPRAPAAVDFTLYKAHLNRWVPGAEIRPKPAQSRFAMLSARVGGKAVSYLVEEKCHLRHQDAGVVAEQLQRWRAELPRAHAADSILLLAPHVREQQAAVLERAGIDYLDLAGNVHLSAPGLFVHVEGRRPPKVQVTGPVRPQKGWVKTVLALLAQPDLVDAPYRALSDQADVSLGTVAACLRDLTLRGLVLDADGHRRLPDRAALVALWVHAYGEALRPKLPERRLQVRAGEKPELWARLQTILGARGERWALTGADAAGQRDHFLRTEETEIYAPARLFDDRALQQSLVAQPAARGGNLLVIQPPGPLAIPTTDTGTIPVAPDLLAYAELRYRGTEQAQEAADLLLPSVLGDAAA